MLVYWGQVGIEMPSWLSVIKVLFTIFLIDLFSPYSCFYFILCCYTMLCQTFKQNSAYGISILLLCFMGSSYCQVKELEHVAVVSLELNYFFCTLGKNFIIEHLELYWLWWPITAPAGVKLIPLAINSDNFIQAHDKLIKKSKQKWIKW